MRVLMEVAMPNGPFNTFVREGKAGDKIGRVLEEIQPEAAYFSERNGHRDGTLICEMENASDIPRLAEPFLLTFDADVEFHVCMTPDDRATRTSTKSKRNGSKMPAGTGASPIKIAGRASPR